jgi:hypothetical protein
MGSPERPRSRLSCGTQANASRSRTLSLFLPRTPCGLVESYRRFTSLSAMLATMVTRSSIEARVTDEQGSFPVRIAFAASYLANFDGTAALRVIGDVPPTEGSPITLIGYEIRARAVATLGNISELKRQFARAGGQGRATRQVDGMPHLRGVPRIRAGLLGIETQWPESGIASWIETPPKTKAASV